MGIAIETHSVARCKGILRPKHKKNKYAQKAGRERTERASAIGCGARKKRECHAKTTIAVKISNRLVNG